MFENNRSFAGCVIYYCCTSSGTPPDLLHPTNSTISARDTMGNRRHAKSVKVTPLLLINTRPTSTS